jgi:hypothetical protein
VNNIPYGMAVEVAKTRWQTATESPDTTGWLALDDNTRSIFVDMARVWVQAYSYRAAYEAMPLGIYTTRDAAQEHCLHDLRANVDLEDEQPLWVQDQGEEAVSELNIQTAPGNGESTGYTVTPVELQTAFDPTREN